MYNGCESVSVVVLVKELFFSYYQYHLIFVTHRTEIVTFRKNIEEVTKH
jgi:hypothetical protein